MNAPLPWPKDLWVVWAPGMRPWACLNEEAANEHAYFCQKNGHFDIEIQRYAYDIAFKRVEWKPKEVLTEGKKAGIQNAQGSKGKGETKKASKARSKTNVR